MDGHDHAPGGARLTPAKRWAEAGTTEAPSRVERRPALPRKRPPSPDGWTILAPIAAELGVDSPVEPGGPKRPADNAVPATDAERVADLEHRLQDALNELERREAELLEQLEHERRVAAEGAETLSAHWESAAASMVQDAERRFATVRDGLESQRDAEARRRSNLEERLAAAQAELAEAGQSTTAMRATYLAELDAERRRAQQAEEGLAAAEARAAEAEERVQAAVATEGERTRQLEEQLASARADHEQLQAQERQRADALEQDLAATRDELNVMIGVIDELRATHADELAAHHGDAEQTHAQLRAQHAEELAEHVRARETVEQQLVAAEQQHAATRDELAETQRQLADARSEAEQRLADAHADAQQRLAEARSEGEQRVADAHGRAGEQYAVAQAQWAAERESLENVAASLQQRVHELDQLLAETREQLVQSRDQLAATHEQLVQSRDQLAATHEQLAQARAAQASADERAADAQSRSTELTARVDALERQLADERDRHAVGLSSAQQQLEHLQGDFAAILDTERTEAQRRIADVEHAGLIATQRADQAERERDEFREALAGAVQEVGTERIRVAGLERALSEAGIKLADARARSLGVERTLADVERTAEADRIRHAQVQTDLQRRLVAAETRVAELEARPAEPVRARPRPRPGG